MNDPRDYTPAQAADRMQISEKSVYALLNAGALRGYRIGRLWRIRPQDLESVRRPQNLGQFPPQTIPVRRAPAPPVSQETQARVPGGRLPGWDKFAPTSRRRAPVAKCDRAEFSRPAR